MLPAIFQLFSNKHCRFHLILTGFDLDWFVWLYQETLLQRVKDVYTFPEFHNINLLSWIPETIQDICSRLLYPPWIPYCIQRLRTTFVEFVNNKYFTFTLSHAMLHSSDFFFQMFSYQKYRAFIFWEYSYFDYFSHQNDMHDVVCIKAGRNFVRTQNI